MSSENGFSTHKITDMSLQIESCRWFTSVCWKQVVQNIRLIKGYLF